MACRVGIGGGVGSAIGGVDFGNGVYGGGGDGDGDGGGGFHDETAGDENVDGNIPRRLTYSQACTPPTGAGAAVGAARSVTPMMEIEAEAAGKAPDALYQEACLLNHYVLQVDAPQDLVSLMRASFNLAVVLEETWHESPQRGLLEKFASYRAKLNIANRELADRSIHGQWYEKTYQDDCAQGRRRNRCPPSCRLSPHR